MRVAIAGAGNVGLFIANDLRAADHDVMIIEQLPAVGEEFANPVGDCGFEISGRDAAAS